MTGARHDTQSSRPRRRSAPWRRRTLRWGLPLLVVAAAAGAAAWSWDTGRIESAIAGVRAWAITSSAQAGLRIEEVLVIGRDQTQRADLFKAVGLRRGMPILGFEPEEVRKRVEALPWVREAAVERRLPSTVYLRIIERRPMALWQHEDRFSLIDTEGAVIPGGSIGDFATLPLVVGAAAPPHVPELLRILESQPDLMARVSAAVFVSGRRWNIRLENGVDVRLPEDDALAAWSRLAALERSHRILARDIRVLDLRLPDRMIVKTAPASAATTGAKGRET